MQKTCDVCGNDKTRRKHSKVGTLVTCPQCGSSFDYYYRKDGRLLDYPSSWGRLVEVIYEPSGAERMLNADSAFDTVYIGDFYYIFLATDGTIRRARIDSYGVFDDETPRPKGVPKNVNTFHTWVVDVLPSSGETDRS